MSPIIPQSMRQQSCLLEFSLFFFCDAPLNLHARPCWFRCYWFAMLAMIIRAVVNWLMPVPGGGTGCYKCCMCETPPPERWSLARSKLSRESLVANRASLFGRGSLSVAAANRIWNAHVSRSGSVTSANVETAATHESEMHGLPVVLTEPLPEKF